jgi:hypothetical protein
MRAEFVDHSADATSRNYECNASSKSCASHDRRNRARGKFALSTQNGSLRKCRKILRAIWSREP